MVSAKIIAEYRPKTEDLQKFSTGLSELIGSVNPVEAAYKATVMQKFVDMIKASDTIIPPIMSVAELDIRHTSIVISADRK